MQPQPVARVNLIPDPTLVGSDEVQPFWYTDVDGTANSSFSSVSGDYSFAGGAAMRAANFFNQLRINIANALPATSYPALTAGQTYTLIVHTLLTYPLSAYSAMRVRAFRTSVARPATEGAFPLSVSVLSTQVQGTWVRSEVTFTPTVTDTYNIEVDATANAGIPAAAWGLYASSFMLLAGNVVGQNIAYFDGDKPGCYWEGGANTSPSVNPAGNTEYGIWADIETLTGVVVREQQGSGAAVVDNQILLPAQGSLGYLTSTNLATRETTLGLWISAENTGFDGLLSKRRKLLALFPPGTERIIGYEAAADMVTLKVVYSGGMQFTNKQGFSEEPGLILTSPDPHWYSAQRDVGGALPTHRLLTSQATIRRRLNDGEWANMGGITGNINTIHIDSTTGTVYIGGTFLNDPSTSVTLNRVAKWNNTTGRWEAMASGLAGEVYDLQVVGTLYAATANGIFMWNDSAWSLVTATVYRTIEHTMLTDDNLNGNIVQTSYGANGQIRASDTYYDRALQGSVAFVGGSFTTATIGGVGTPASRVLMAVNGSGFSAMSPGLNGDVYGVAVDAAREYAYFVGLFTGTVGNTVVSPGIIRYKIATNSWEAVGKGITRKDNVFATITPNTRAVAANRRGRVVYLGQWSIDSVATVGGTSPTTMGEVINGATTTLDLRMSSNTVPKVTAIDDAGTMYAAFDTIAGVDATTFVGAVTTITSNALAAITTILRIPDGALPIRMDNINTGALVLFNPTASQLYGSSVTDIDMQSGNGYKAGRWNTPLVGTVVRGSNTTGMQIQPGVNRFRMFGFTYSTGVVNVGQPVILRGRMRHTSVDGGAV